MPPADDFSTVQAAIDALTADPAVEFAMLDTAMNATVVPQPSSFPDWRWDAGRADGNWQFQLSGFPAAWNLIDPIRARGVDPSVVTAICEVLGEGHLSEGKSPEGSCDEPREFRFLLFLTT